MEFRSVFFLQAEDSIRDIGVTGVQTCALPIFSRLPETLRAIWHALGSVDTVWALGPAPMSIPVAVLGLARKKQVVLGVRQDRSEERRVGIVCRSRWTTYY